MPGGMFSIYNQSIVILPNLKNIACMRYNCFFDTFRNTAFDVENTGIVLCAKNLTQLRSKILFEISSENDVIFLAAFYLIICLMKAKQNFEKNSHFEKTTADFILR